MTGHTTGHGAAAAASGLRCVLRWFLIFTKPGGEQRAKTHLERQGYRVYYPRLLCSARHRGHWVERVVSLFPRYLFVQLDAACQSLAPVRSTVGVVNIVRFGPQPAVVPDQLIESLVSRADPHSRLHRLSTTERFEPGARVNIVAGAFEGLEGIFEREVGDERVVVLLELLGHSTPVRIPAAFVVPGAA